MLRLQHLCLMRVGRFLFESCSLLRLDAEHHFDLSLLIKRCHAAAVTDPVLLSIVDNDDALVMMCGVGRSRLRASHARTATACQRDCCPATHRYMSSRTVYRDEQRWQSGLPVGRACEHRAVSEQAGAVDAELRLPSAPPP